MTAITPEALDHAALGPLDARYVDVAALPWRPTPYEGVEMKVLLEDEESGLLTALFRWAPGAVLPFHEHVEIEQSYVLEGGFEDDAGVCRAGDFVWRPAGSRHQARSADGCLLIAFFLRPNIFLDPGET